MASSGCRRLTEFSHGAGCGCKLAPGVLRSVVGGLDLPVPPELLVGASTGDDAAVWRLDDGRALVATTDVITPVVDDARTWGRVAATNAMSDVWVMGGRPLFALNLVFWNHDELGPEPLAEVLGGGAEAAAAAACAVVGGHSVTDPEPKYGLAVIGEVDPARLLTNAGLRPGDAVVLTKALGVGVITTAIKTGDADPAHVEAAVASMTTPNALAARVALDAGATGATDVTGFGLFVHLGRMAAESGVAVEIDTFAVPVLDGVRDLVQRGIVPGGTRRNLEFASGFLDPGDLDAAELLVLADAQTSGGLCFGAQPEAAAEAVAVLQAAGQPAAVIGRALAPARMAGAGHLRLMR